MRRMDNPNAHRELGRRCLLSAAVALLLLAADRRSAAEPAGLSADNDFMQLSRLLIARTDLDPRIGHRLNAALTAAHRGFSTRVTGCTAFARAQGLTAAEPFAAALQAQQPSLAPVLHIVVAAWYTGVAGDGPLAAAIAYREALMFDTVRDVLTVPSYCRAAPGYWTIKPPTV
jgi:hypothetical protein